MKNLSQIAKEQRISKRTLIARANVLKISKVGNQFVVSKEDEKRLLDPSLHKVGKPSQKTPSF